MHQHSVASEHCSISRKLRKVKMCVRSRFKQCIIKDSSGISSSTELIRGSSAKQSLICLQQPAGIIREQGGGVKTEDKGGTGAASLCNLYETHQPFHYQRNVTDRVQQASGCPLISNLYEGKWGGRQARSVQPCPALLRTLRWCNP